MQRTDGLEPTGCLRVAWTGQEHLYLLQQQTCLRTTPHNEQNGLGIWTMCPRALQQFRAAKGQQRGLAEPSECSHFCKAASPQNVTRIRSTRPYKSMPSTRSPYRLNSVTFLQNRAVRC